MKRFSIRHLMLILGAAVATACEPKPAEKAAVSPRSSGMRAFDQKLAEIHRDWMGTPWAYSGTSQTPRQGAIACGYFVTTTLQQAGLSVDRVRLAQAASEQMIVELTPPDSVRRYRGASLNEFLDGLRRQGEGYYIVGLDYHTGFLRVTPDGEVVFIHSGMDRGVVEEAPSASPELARSRYRVTGKISLADPVL